MAKSLLIKDTSIGDTTTQADGAKASATYTLDGKQTTSAQRGVRIIRYTDGTTKKMM